MGTTRHTLDDLAETLGLSPNTVSRALRGKDGVSERTRKLVLDEAVRVGYILPPQPRTVEETETLAVTIPSATHAFASRLLGSIESGVRAAGYSLDLYVTDELPDQENQITQQIIRSRPAGVIAIPVQGTGHGWEQVHAAGIPIVAASRDIADVPADFVGVDSEAGSYAAARHLIGTGARRILCLDEDLAISTIEARQHGVERALSTAPGVDIEFVNVPTRRFENTGPEWRAQEGHRVVSNLLADPQAFDAVLSGDDFFAFGALKALRELDRTVPGEVRVTGYGDLPFAAWSSPALTSIRLPAVLVGELAVATLLQRVAGGSGPATQRLIRPELIVRDSSVTATESAA